MSGISFPVQVALLLRRLVNVISTFSVSNQYLLLKQARAEEKAALDSDGSRPTRTALSSLKLLDWRWVLWNTPVGSDSSAVHGMSYVTFQLGVHLEDFCSPREFFFLVVIPHADYVGPISEGFRTRS